MDFSIKPATFLVLILALFAVYFFRVHPVANSDTYYHLAVGREVVTVKAIPTKDNFVYGSKNTQYVSTEWLSGVTFYLLVKNLGINSLFLLRSFLGILTLLYLYKSLKIIDSNSLLNICAVVIIGYLLPMRFSTRPEMFSLAFLSIMNYIGLSLVFKKKISPLIYSTPLVFTLWHNLHGFSILGLFVYTFFVGVFLIQNKGRVLNLKIISIYILSTLPFLIQYKQSLAFIHTNSFSKYITEWASLWQRVFPSSEFKGQFQGLTTDILLFAFFFVLYLIFFYKSLKKFPPYKNLIFIFYLCLLFLPFKFFRLIVPILLLATPSLIFLLSTSIAVNGIKSKIFLKLLISLIIIVIGYSIAISHQLAGEKIGSVFPSKAAEFVKSNLNTKKLFTIYYWNDYFIWTIPGVKTYADVMSQYRTIDDLEDERRLHSPENDVTDLLKKYDIDTIVSTQPQTKSIIGSSLTPVYKLNDWEIVYIDNVAVVYAKKNVVKKKLITLSDIHPELETVSKYYPEKENEAISQLEGLLEYDQGNDFAREQLINYYFVRKKDFAKAQELTRESMRVSPDNPFFSFVMASIYLNQKDCESALKYAHESAKKNLMNPELKSATNEILYICE